jgi:uncharacterized protein
MQKTFWFTLGSLSLALGIIGILLPLLPTTPFVILTAFAYGRSSPRCQRWLERSRTFGPILADWQANGAIAPRHKAVAVTTMAGSLALGIWFAIPPLALAVQAICLGGAALFVLTRPNGGRKPRYSAADRTTSRP